MYYLGINKRCEFDYLSVVSKPAEECPEDLSCTLENDQYKMCKNTMQNKNMCCIGNKYREISNFCPQIVNNCLTQNILILTTQITIKNTYEIYV